MRAERHAACRRLSFNAVAGGVPPSVSGRKRGFSPGRGKRPAAGFTQKLGAPSMTRSRLSWYYTYQA